MAASEVSPIDAVLLSHDHHADNLDNAGRALLASASEVVTTVPGARRLGGHARGLESWETTRLESPGKPAIEVTATPCRHGPPLSRPLAGQVVGFALCWEGQEHGALWITGDTVLYEGVRQVANRIAVDTVLLHLGGVKFPVTGPLRYSMTARQAIELCSLIRPRTAIPVHYEGWKHFQESREKIERELAAAPDDIRRTVRWLPSGAPSSSRRAPTSRERRGPECWCLSHCARQAAVVRRATGGPRRRVAREYGRCPARTGDLLLVRREQFAAVYCRLSLMPLDERQSAKSCCPLLRFVASTALPQAGNPITPERAGLAPCSAAAGEPLTRCASVTGPGSEPWNHLVIPQRGGRSDNGWRRLRSWARVWLKPQRLVRVRLTHVQTMMEGSS